MKVEKILETLEAVVHSEKIREFKPGISSNSKARRSQYFGIGFDYYIVLATGLSAQQALRLEEKVYKAIHEKNKPLLYQKFDKKSRDKGGTPKSLGGKDPKNEELYDFYIACFAS